MLTLSIKDLIKYIYKIEKKNKNMYSISFVMNKKTILALFLIILIGLSAGSFVIIVVIFQNDERTQFFISGKIIDDFAYYLQDIRVESVVDSKYDFVIIDFSSNGEESGEYSRNAVTTMKSSGECEKLLISYISIGEAENYRFYWENKWDSNNDGVPEAAAPDWLDIENPDWEGNYKVKYWKHGWQKVIFKYLDKIINAGFDGIYMDIIDAYEYYQKTIPHADLYMVNFVVNISNYVKAKSGFDFAVFVQNGNELLLNSKYLNNIDGIGREDLFFNDNARTTESWREKGLNNLNKALEANKVVLIIDYPTTENNIQEFYELCVDNSFIPYAAERELGNLREYIFYPAT